MPPVSILELDTDRPYTAEPRLTRVVNSKNIPLLTWPDQRLYKWGTGSITLRPVNLAPDFATTSHYEALKFRLADCNYQQGWWGETPQINGVTQHDYFLYTQVQAPNVQLPAADTSYSILKQLSDISQRVLNTAANQVVLEQTKQVAVLTSSQQFPMNQGYMLRFIHNGRPTTESAGIIDFYFGDYALRLNGDGTAQIWQTFDYTQYFLWETFQWCDSSNVFDSHQRIWIYPHNRNKIEFICQTTLPATTSYQYSEGPSRSSGVIHEAAQQLKPYSHIFTVRNDVGSAEFLGQITAQGNWGLGVNRNYPVFIQVSQIGFYNGTDKPATVTDTPALAGTIAPTVQINSYLKCDIPPGTSATGQLLNADSGRDSTTPWTSNGSARSYAFKFGLTGDSVFPAQNGGPIFSGSSPEIYGYIIDKPPLIVDAGLTPQYFNVLDVKIDSGGTPEQYTSTFTLDNSENQLASYTNRSHINYRLLDQDSGRTLSEGVIHEVTKHKASSQGLVHAVLSGHGMSDSLTMNHCLDLDFTTDPLNPDQPASWQTAATQCFAHGGFDSTQVLFEDVGETSGKSWDFALWTENDAGGAQKGSVKAVSQDGERWRPNPNVPVYQFLDHLLREVFAWYYWWNYPDRIWHIYKRPTPQEIAATIPKAAFFIDVGQLLAFQSANSQIPAYVHEGMSETTQRPECTSIECWSNYGVPGIPSKQVLQQIQADTAAGKNLNQPILVGSPQAVLLTYDNPNGYKHPNGPAVDANNPDFLVNKITRVFNLMLAGSQEAHKWLTRRVAEDYCFGYVFNMFQADWGDQWTYNLRKWDVVIIDPDPDDQQFVNCRYLIDRVEPEWKFDVDRKARYRVSQYRGIHPPM